MHRTTCALVKTLKGSSGHLVAAIIAQSGTESDSENRACTFYLKMHTVTCFVEYDRSAAPCQEPLYICCARRLGRAARLRLMCSFLCFMNPHKRPARARARVPGSLVGMSLAA